MNNNSNNHRPGSRSSGYRRTTTGASSRSGSASGRGSSYTARTSASSAGTRSSAGSTRATAKSQSAKRPSAAAASPRKKHKKVKKHPKLRLFLKLFFLVILLAILAGMGIFYYKYGNTLLRWQAEAKEMVSASTEDTFKASEASFIYDSKGKVLAKLKGEKDSYYLTIDQIPQYVKDAFVVTEDRDFYKHQGYDPKALVSACWSLVVNKLKGEDASRGASTITQQLARNVFTDYLDYTDKSYSRKVRELFVATEMEKKYTKDQILEFYINNAYFANGYYGIEAASRGYFSTTVSKLGLAEIAFLCSIPNRPQTYDPLEHFDNTISRKNRILDQMLSEECITAAEYSDAYYQDIVLNPATEVKTQNYLTTYAVSCATKALMEKQGFEFRYDFASDADRSAYDKEYDEVYDECYKSLYTSGYNIYTTLSKRIQKKLQDAVNGQLAGFTEKTDGTFAFQGAATCINNKTGKVVAIVGGRKQKSTTGYTLNRAFQSFRQPGSCFKPLAVYTPQLERDYTADTIVDDTYFDGGPRNSDGSYSGKIPLRTAVEKSKNVIAWKLFEELTPAVGLSYVKKMNFSKIVDDDYVPAAALGGLTNGVSTVEMASAYATLANDGKFRNPTCIKKITDYDGNVVVNMNKITKEKEVYTAAAAEAMTDILEGVLVRGTGAGKQLSNMACAGKTGTTSDKKDGWFCGYTPYYTTAVWVGFDTPKEVSNLYGSTYPLYIWHQFMEELHSGMEYTSFSYDAMGSGDDSDYDDTEYYEETTETAEPEETVDPEVIETEEEDTDNDVTDEEEPDDSTSKKPQATQKASQNSNQSSGQTKPSNNNNNSNSNDYDDVGEETTVEDVDATE
jgi:membrane peptidoglycan carboxypeptidase